MRFTLISVTIPSGNSHPPRESLSLSFPSLILSQVQIISPVSNVVNPLCHAIHLISYLAQLSQYSTPLAIFGFLDSSSSIPP